MSWMHSCRRVSELLSQRLDEPLGWLDRTRLRLHLSMCGDCRNVERQMDDIRAAAGDLFAADPVEPAAGPPGLSSSGDNRS